MFKYEILEMLNRILKRLFIFKSVITFDPFIGNKKYKFLFKKFNNQVRENKYEIRSLL